MFRPASVGRTIASSFVGLLFLRILYEHCRMGGQRSAHAMFLVALVGTMVISLTFAPDSTLELALNYVQCMTVTFGIVCLGLLVFRRKFVEALGRKKLYIRRSLPRVDDISGATVLEYGKGLGLVAAMCAFIIPLIIVLLVLLIPRERQKDIHVAFLLMAFFMMIGLPLYIYLKYTRIVISNGELTKRTLRTESSIKLDSIARIDENPDRFVLIDQEGSKITIPRSMNGAEYVLEQLKQESPD
jgi:hypothetical protein